MQEEQNVRRIKMQEYSTSIFTKLMKENKQNLQKLIEKQKEERKILEKHMEKQNQIMEKRSENGETKLEYGTNLEKMERKKVY